jgi:hypothetical protein
MEELNLRLPAGWYLCFDQFQYPHFREMQQRRPSWQATPKVNNAPIRSPLFRCASARVPLIDPRQMRVLSYLRIAVRIVCQPALPSTPSESERGSTPSKKAPSGLLKLAPLNIPPPHFPLNTEFSWVNS